MEQVIIVYGWLGHSQENWFPWLKKQLATRGYQVTVPEFPNPKSPQLKAWLKKLKQVIGEPDENLILVGHSLGVNLIHRYLEALPAGTQIKAAICVATPTKTSVKPYKPIHNFLAKDFNWQKIKTKAKHWFIIGSDNDPYIPLKEIKKIPQQLASR
jgi:predicted alpha/beta hydrolase family esterase